MSRTAKNSQQELFSKLPQQPPSPGIEEELDMDCLSPRNDIKSVTTIKETAAGSDLQDQTKLSKTQLGVAIMVSELFEEMKTKHAGLSFRVRMRSSAPIVSMSMLNQKNNKNNNQKKFKRMSSQKVIRRVKATREIAIGGSKEEKRLRALVSLNPEVIKPREMLERFMSMTQMQDQVYIVALIYLKRAFEMEPDLEFKHLHKLLAGCLLLAHKYLIEGQFWDFEDFGFLSGVSPAQLESIEKCIVRRVLRFSLYVSEEEYEGFLSTLTLSLASTENF